MTNAPPCRIALARARAYLLLAPEGGLLSALFLASFVSSAQTIAGLLAAAVIVTFAVRTLALYLARLALEQARYWEADALLHVSLALWPWSADGLALRGVLAVALGAPDKAVAALRRAAALLPWQASFHAALAGALLAQGQGEEAAAAARRALALDPTNATAHLSLAEAEMALGAAPHAVEDRLRAGLRAARAPEMAAALQCALAAHLFEESRLAEGALALRAAEALLGRCAPARQAELRFRIGELLAAAGQTEHAREHFLGAAALDPEGRHAAAAWHAARTS
jgi:tetratricopeptide (TPR) repeat protein